MKKERFEWMHSWCDETAIDNLPRVLLIGDSICNNYQHLVRENLKGVAVVDYVATSYAVDSKMYNLLVENFAKDSKYDVIHINHGLHGFHINIRTYTAKMDKLINKLRTQGKVILCETTAVKTQGNKRYDTAWMKKVRARNGAISSLSQKYKLKVNPLFDLSVSINDSHRMEDGVHYLESGSAILAEQVARVIKEEL